MSVWPTCAPSQPVSTTRSARSFSRNATARDCATGRSASMTRRHTSSVASFSRNCTAATSPASSARASVSANRGSAVTGVIRYSRHRSGVSLNSGRSLALIDPDDRLEHLQRVLLRPLERVAADDAAVGAAVAQAADLLVDRLDAVLRLAAGEHHDPPPV